MERNELKYVKTKMWSAGRAWREVPVRKRSSKEKALHDWALKEELEKRDLNVGRRPCSVDASIDKL